VAPGVSYQHISPLAPADIKVPNDTRYHSFGASFGDVAVLGVSQEVQMNDGTSLHTGNAQFDDKNSHMM
jgi:hypothetical protein